MLQQLHKLKYKTNLRPNSLNLVEKIVIVVSETG